MSILCLIGSVLNVKKMSMSFVLWTISNVFWLAYDIYCKFWARAVLDVVNLVTSTWGIVKWIKDEHEDPDASND